MLELLICMSYPDDQAARLAAIDLDRSFIVQAPAGSGKTELLIQRFLAALADANQLPEEVLAITFTRKAASEMQARVVSALSKASDNINPENPHAAKTAALAKLCLAKSQALGWSILDNQHRLCIMTIDAMCSKINQQSLAFIPSPHPAPIQFYRKVVQDFLHDLEIADCTDLQACWLYFDHQPKWLENLLCESLASRDQWLPLIFMHNDPQQANECYIDNIWHSLLTELDQLHQDCDISVLKSCYQNLYLPTDCVKTEAKRLANIMLTTTGQPRASFTTRQGLPAASSCKGPALKEELKLKKQELVMLANSQLQLWQKIQLAPLIEDQELNLILPRLLKLMQKLVAYLKLHFQTDMSTDFIEQTQATIASLEHNIEWPNSEGIPRPGTIRHLLLDEFQDTSRPQMQLLSSLLAHCDTSDRNSILIVGDPMQSIYRFRQADVSLFYQVQKQGIAGFNLDCLQLSSNFRSNKDLITYFNNLFPNIFPQKANPSLGAVPYNPATASNQESSKIEFLSFDEQISEFKAIASLCHQHQGSTIGILVRSRAIARALLPYLSEFSVHEHGLKSCFESPEAQDLLAITEFLAEPYDTVKTAALLRSRLIGFSLQELYYLCNHGTGGNLIESLIIDSENSQLLSIQNKYQNFAIILQDACELNAGISLYERTLNLWRLLSPYANQNQVTSQISWEYLAFLEQAEQIAPEEPIAMLYELLSGPVAVVQVSDINIMTIHHAKGLEFDVVILPCLDKTTAARSSRVLWWEQTSNNFFWLPNHPNQKAISSAHKHVYDLNSRREEQEQIRLLYVAMTRAKKHLYGLAEIDDKPSANSFAGLLWPWVEFQKRANTEDCQHTVSNMLEYLVPDLELIEQAKNTRNHLKLALEQQQTAPLTDTINNNFLNANSQQILGIAWHYWLYLYAKNTAHDLLEQQTQLHLLEQGFERTAADNAMLAVVRTWQEMKNSTFIQWLKTQVTYPEFEVTVKGKKHVLDLLVVLDDRLIIIDYKTQTNPCSQELERWYQQTDRYRCLLAKTTDRSNISIFIYNPTDGTIWQEQEHAYVRSSSNTCFS